MSTAALPYGTQKTVRVLSVGFLQWRRRVVPALHVQDEDTGEHLGIIDGGGETACLNDLGTVTFHADCPPEPCGFWTFEPLSTSTP